MLSILVHLSVSVSVSLSICQAVHLSVDSCKPSFLNSPVNQFDTNVAYLVFSLNLVCEYGQYIRIQRKTTDLSMRLWGVTRVCGVYSSEPCAEVYCVRLNFIISKLIYYLSITINWQDKCCLAIIHPSVCQKMSVNSSDSHSVCLLFHLFT